MNWGGELPAQWRKCGGESGCRSPIPSVHRAATSASASEINERRTAMRCSESRRGLPRHGVVGEMPEQPDGIFIRAPDIRLRIGLQIPEDAERVGDLGDPERVTRWHRAIHIARVENRRYAIAADLEGEAVGLEAHPPDGVARRDGGDVHRCRKRLRMQAEKWMAHACVPP